MDWKRRSKVPNFRDLSEKGTGTFTVSKKKKKT